MVGGEPTAYHLYKRRDLEQKIDKLAVDRLRMAKMVFNVTTQARKDRTEYLKLREMRDNDKRQHILAKRLAALAKLAKGVPVFLFHR